MNDIEKFYTDLTISTWTDNDEAGAEFTLLTPSDPYTGFIQPLAASNIRSQGKGAESGTHRLYTRLETPTAYGSKVIQDSQEYTVLTRLQPTGISGVNHHKEVNLGIFQ